MNKMVWVTCLALAFVCFSLFQTHAQTRSKTVSKQDSTQNAVLHEVVVSASRFQERFLKSPVSIEKINLFTFKLSAAPSFFDALENVKGVQLITPSLGFRVINTRGFANTTNVRFVQLVDGVDNQAPEIGAPIGNSLGPSDLDIQSVEIIPGTASALYGLNAINGLANFITKNPFASIGIAIQQKTAVNHISDPSSKARLFTETSLRIDHVFNGRLAIKLNGTFTKGYDWIANNHDDLNASANAKLGISAGPLNPGYDPVNGYGNESSDRTNLTLGGKIYSVARTGYSENQVADYNLRNIKADATIAFKLSTHHYLSYTYRFALLNDVYQRANRFSLKNYLLQQHVLGLTTPFFQIKSYVTSENTGKSYNLRSAAENVDNAFKPQATWYQDFTMAFNQNTAAGSTVAQALAAARAQADNGRYVPGTPAFNHTLGKVNAINNWDVGAALRVKDYVWNTDAQLNLGHWLFPSFSKQHAFGLQAGVDQRTYIILPDGNYFINFVGPDPYKIFTYGKTGGFIQAEKTLFNKTLSVTGAIRADKNDYFSVKFNPRLTLVYSPSLNQNIRFSYQSGYRFPSIFEAFSNVNSGGVKRIGGLRIASNGVFENAYLRNSIDAFQAAVKNDINTNGLQASQAIVKEKGLLVKNPYTYIQPEHIQSFELGYKGLLIGNDLFLDADAYYNKYNRFIGQVEMNVPKTALSDSIPFYLNSKTAQNRYRVWTNSRTTVYNYGASLGLTYHLLETYTASGNVSFSKLDRKANDDGLEDGFNTPQYITNLSFGSLHAYKNFGFNVTHKWQRAYYWQSFLVNGRVPGYYTLDAEISYLLGNPNLEIKVGASNVFNRYYYSILGGPSIGGLYYTSFTYCL